MRTVLVCLVAVMLAQVGPPPAPVVEQLTEVQALKLDNLNLQVQLLNAKMQDLQKQAAALKAEIEAAHPCCTFDLATGKLVKKEKQ